MFQHSLVRRNCSLVGPPKPLLRTKSGRTTRPNSGHSDKCALSDRVHATETFRTGGEWLHIVDDGPCYEGFSVQECAVRDNFWKVCDPRLSSLSRIPIVRFATHKRHDSGRSVSVFVGH